jgi:hypothetical protein
MNSVMKKRATAGGIMRGENKFPGPFPFRVLAERISSLFDGSHR